ncbi:response regulator transcription factor [Streptomyces sp. 7N604]|uniref:response regulator transcription factor n=1 Tax=Streptomyces sp. 7N604 TaxID=3457415 RepID=UPI003FCF90DE
MQSGDAATVLLADDEKAITEQLRPVLQRAGFQVSVVHDGSASLRRLVEDDPDLIVLDVVMPGLSGRDVLRELRRQGRWTPVVLLTRVGESTERAMALEEGADDYLNKPFDPYELVARLRAVLRRARRGLPPLVAAQQLRAGALRLDRVSRRTWLAGRELTLTPKAALLLDYLMTHPDELLTRERLLEALWGWQCATGTRAVDNRIAELRRALGDEPGRAARWIETVPGQGYRFAVPVERMA